MKQGRIAYINLETGDYSVMMHKGDMTKYENERHDELIHNGYILITDEEIIKELYSMAENEETNNEENKEYIKERFKDYK